MTHHIRASLPSPTLAQDLPRGLQVLILEDEAMIAMLLEDMLSELGCEIVGPVDDVGSALELLEEQTPQMALLDVNLRHGQSSYKVAEALAGRGVPFAFVTGQSPEGLEPPFRDRPTLQKPFHLAALVDVVRQMSASF